MKVNKDTGPDIAHTLGIGRSSSKIKLLKRWIGWGIPVLIVALVLIFRIARNTAETMQFKTEAARSGNLTVAVSATGNLEPTNQVDIGSELSGIIETVEVDFNDRVKAGQILARLDTDKLEARVLQSKAALESARAQLLQAQATIKEKSAGLERMRQAQALSGGKVPSQYELDSAEASLQRAMADEAGAKAKIAEAQATLEVDEADLSKALIRSPINGIVLSRNVEPGQTVAASLQAPVLFTLAEDLTQMELHVDVDEADVGQVAQGQDATFTVDAYPGRTFPARITQVRYGSQTTGGVVTYKTVLKVDNSDLLLRPGMTATADIVVKKVENAILVPNAALRFIPPVIKDKPDDSSDKRTMISRIFPRPSHRNRSSSSNNRRMAGEKAQQLVWTLKNGEPDSISITTGATDGITTQVTSGEIEPGTVLVVDTVDVVK